MDFMRISIKSIIVKIALFISLFIFFTNCAFSYSTPIGLQNAKLWYEQNTNYKVHIYIEGIKGIELLSYLQNYNSGWRIYLVKHPTSQWCDFEGKQNNVISCKSNYNSISVKDINYLFELDSFSKSHHIYNDYANSWLLNIDKIKKDYSPEYYTKNKNGSINLEIVIFFLPQAYFMLFSIISFIFLILILGMLILLRMKYRK